MEMNLKGSSSDIGLRGTLGIQFNQYFGVEGTWFQLPNTTVSTSLGSANYKGSAYVASVTATGPLNTDIDLVGRIGAGRSDLDIDVSSTSYSSSSHRNLMVWGLGVRYKLEQSIDLTLDYDNLGAVGKYALGDSVMVEMLSIGIRFKY